MTIYDFQNDQAPWSFFRLRGGSNVEQACFVQSWGTSNTSYQIRYAVRKSVDPIFFRKKNHRHLWLGPFVFFIYLNKFSTFDFWVWYQIHEPFFVSYFSPHVHVFFLVSSVLCRVEWWLVEINHAQAWVPEVSSMTQWRLVLNLVDEHGSEKKRVNFPEFWGWTDEWNTWDV